MIGAAKLDAKTYEEVEHDENALPQAVGVVALSSIAAGIGGLGSATSGGFVVTTVVALVGWAVWALIVYLVGTKLMPEAQTKADLGQVLRATGFSAAPGLIRVLGIVPGLGIPSSFVASIWMLVAMVIAVKQALDYTSLARAIGVVVIGFIVYMVVFMMLAAPIAVARLIAS
jgi:hypothetical protein